MAATVSAAVAVAAAVAAAVATAELVLHVGPRAHRRLSPPLLLTLLPPEREQRVGKVLRPRRLPSVQLLLQPH